MTTPILYLEHLVQWVCLL